MMKWTDRQISAITSRGKNLIVSAGAGSGKTAVMIERICSLIEEGKDVRKMAICTFTNAAASEMKSKLAARLAAKAEQCSDASLRRRLESQLGALACADISTLHAWCSHIVRERFFDADVSPEFTILDAGEEGALKRDAAEEAVQAALAEGDGDFEKLYAAFADNRTRSSLVSAAITVYDFARAQPDFSGWLSLKPEKSDEDYKAELYNDISADVKILEKKAYELESRMAAAGFALDEADIASLIAAMRSGQPYTKRVQSISAKNERFADLHDEFKSIKESYGKLCAKLADIDAMPSFATALPLAESLCRLAASLDVRYRALKQSRGKLDFSDVERLALRILASERGADIASAYEYIFVDEYQDINPLQEAILGKFKAQMFYVGDVKQSIYGFRMCRPKYFTEKFRKYGGGTDRNTGAATASGKSENSGEAIKLTENFRSGVEILDFVNRVFTSIMTANCGGTNYAEAQFVAGRNLPSSVRATLICGKEEKAEMQPGIYSPRSDGGEKRSLALEAEMTEVVREITRILENCLVPTAETDGNGNIVYRKTAYKDIAVLVRSRSDFTELLERKLGEASLPAETAASDYEAEDFRSVAAVASVLRLTDNMRDDVNMAACMLSPMIGKFTVDELVPIREAGYGSFCDCVAAARKSNPKVDCFLSAVERLRDFADSHTVAELAGEITSHFDSFNYALAFGGETEAAALDSYLEHLASVTEYDKLHDYLRYTDRVGAPKLELYGGGNAIKIMTVHGSKGLEFPYVILPNLNKRFNVQDTHTRVICSETEGVAVHTYDFDSRTVSANTRYAYCAAQRLKETKSEEMRVLYVAMTRAMCGLTLISRDPGTAVEEKAAEDSMRYTDWLYPYIAKDAERKDLSEYADTLTAAGVRDEAKENGRKSEDACISKAVEAIAGNFDTHYGFGAGPVKVSVSGVIRSGDDERPDAVDLFAAYAKQSGHGGGDDRAAEKGSAYHKLMQWARFGESGEWDRLSALFPRETELADRDETEYAIAEMGRLVSGRKFYREKPFLVRAPACAVMPDTDDGLRYDDVLVQGIIDLLIEDGDGLIIVDYKTGSPAHMYSRAYARQLGWYKYAAEYVLGLRVKAAYLYTFEGKELIKIMPEDVIKQK